MADYSLLSVIVPAYNERNTIHEALRRLREAELPLEREIIVVDDGSNDGTDEIVKRSVDSTVRLITHPVNQGKGAAIRTGIEEAVGDVIVIQDADLEYDPRDLAKLARPLMEGQAQVVYGSRFTGERRNMFFWHWVGNRFLTLLTNVLYNTTLSDMETCYKMFDAGLLRSIQLNSQRFEFEPEVTAKVLRLGERIWEVPITYAGRELAEGKKITWRDGIPAFWALVRYRFTPRSRITR
jgi:glycosyltransferase involved in cell wall biosynthesis